MEPLEVPFVKQLPCHCGPAALEMVYKYFGLDNISQQELFEKIPKQKDVNGNISVLVTDLVSDAISRGFQAYWLEFNNSTKENREGVTVLIRSLIEYKIPFISCGQWKGNRNIGHFRVILKIDENHVYFHDPDIEKCLKYTNESFFKYWRSRESFVGNGGFFVCRAEDTIPPEMKEILDNFSVVSEEEKNFDRTDKKTSV
jgi:predicted double-glycine peptidase